jgi:penicillin-binding protein 1A
MTKKGEIKNNHKRIVRNIWFLYFFGFGLLILLFVLISMGWLGFMPSFEELENPKSNLASEVYSADSVLLGNYYIENRSNIHYDELSPNVINALIATEDIRFTKHSGIDIRGVIRVIFKNIIFGNRKSGGGSTITQQLAKNLFPRQKNQSKIKIVFTKLKEWITAVKLERNYTKEEILAMYLNTVDFGSHSSGIKSAAKTFFNKIPNNLNADEAALLIGILKAPSLYSPVRNPERSLKRRNIVLHQMMKYDYLTKNEYDSLKIIPVDMSEYRLQDQNTGLATYFREYIRGQLKYWCKTHYKTDGTPYNLYKDGLKIYTTIDSRIQSYAEESVSEYIKENLQPLFFKHWKGKHRHPPFDWRMTKKEIDDIMNQALKRSERYRNLKKNNVSEDSIKIIFNTPVKMTVFSWKGNKDTVLTPMDSIKYYKYFLQAGLMSVEPHTGYVKAYVGGINYKYFKYDHVKVGRRQVGSTFKPFLYSLAMQEGEFTPCSKVPNVPVNFKMPAGQPDWTPKNADHKHEGEMVTLKWALANSVNYISAFLMKRYSPQAVIKIVRNMGVTAPIETVPSICLGTPDLSVYEMVGAMNTFANKGIYIKPIFITKIEDKHGNILETFIPEQKEAISEKTAYLMIGLMKGVVQSGTGIRLRYKYHFTNPIAGKTGTTQNNSDGWFIGIVPQLATGIWVGCEDRSVHFRSITLGQGANTSLPIWAKYMKKIYADKSLNIIEQKDFEEPLNRIDVELNCKKYEAQHKKKNPFDNGE